MQVEEDPSSQFVDFTNATDLEQFISDVEQALIGWHLANKGHASLEALTAASAKRVPPPSRRQVAALDAAVWTKELRFQPPGAKIRNSYTLTLFVARHLEMWEKEEPSAPVRNATRKLKKWQEGLEHFTPTMLSVADASRDFHWQVEEEEEMENEEEEEIRPSVSYYTSVFENEAAPQYSRKTVVENVQKWFGVDEFLLLSRSARCDTKKQQTEKKTVNRNDKDVDGDVERNYMEGRDATPERGENGDHEQDEDVIADIQVDQNEAGMLLSALNMALNSCNCTIPAFVPVFEPSRGTWIGSAVPGATGNVSMSFDTDALSPQVEEKCRVGADESGNLAIGMMISASFGFSWNRASDPREEVLPKDPQAWRISSSQQPTELENQIRQITRKLFGENHPIPLLGTSRSPLDGMDLTVSWPQLREGTYVDNVVHSTLDPIFAPQWMLSVRFQDLLSENHRKPRLPLSKQFANLVQVFSNSRELNKDILVSDLAPPMRVTSSPSMSLITPSATRCGEASPTQPLSTLPESIPAARAAVVLSNAISSLVSAATWKGSDVEEIRRILSELFNDGEEEAKDKDDNEGSSCTLNGNLGVALASIPNSVQHGAPLGELVSIIATRMSQLRGINSMSLLWVEFVKALRERWFQQRLLPFMNTSTDEGVDRNTSPHSLDTLFLLNSDAIQLPPPDYRRCLLHQKLQLLNCCIFREAQELKLTSVTRVNSVHRRHDSSAAEDAIINSLAVVNGGECEDELDGAPSDDEFFDSIEQDSGLLPASRHPEGVLSEALGVVCLQTDETLLEPATQTSVPMTEDVAKEQQDLLTRLGVSVESEKLRQQIQSTALISDMQAFKAANPRSCLADFIRWYSPKDWIPFKTSIDPLITELPPEGQGVWWFERHGMLSERMRFGPDHEHMWQRMWETSAPVPASRQKRSFDPVQESEKVYHYMETISPHELFHQMLAGAISSSVFALETALPVHVSSQTLPVVHRALQNLCSRGNRAIALLDEALAESQMAFSAAGRSKQRCSGGNEQSVAAHQDQQLQVAFEMALDACWKLVRSLEAVEALVTKALALLHYFPANEQSALALVNLLLLPSLSRRQQAEISNLLKQDNLRQLVAALVLTNPTLAETETVTVVPVQREYVLRCICPRPFLREYCGDLLIDEKDVEARDMQSEHKLEESPLVVCRMYAAFKKSTVRFALVLAESEF
ncbi:unnamed protein product [Peronospora destructor]|uniref:Rab3 GTPase-activating protein catalytic subunit n=1 Tax=Peronospora destructor TaxID=86335 RepID=A0AAV0TQV8_9STRA|nr:unnamed protein product [Peronospora destructor]